MDRDHVRCVLEVARDKLALQDLEDLLIPIGMRFAKSVDDEVILLWKIWRGAEVSHIIPSGQAVGMLAGQGGRGLVRGTERCRAA